MKRISIILTICIFVLLCTSLISCNKAKSDEESNEKEIIYYSTNIGTRIESLSKSDQEMIDSYAQDCVTIYIHSYEEGTAEQMESFGTFKRYLAITETFVYDFRDCNLESSEKMLRMFTSLRTDEKTPIMYVELNGYISYYDNYINIPISSSPIINGFFIFDDGTYVQLTYKLFATRFYLHNTPEGTVTINCGNKYSKEMNGGDFLVFNQEPKTLTPCDKVNK